MSDISQEAQEHRVYRKRWAVLFILCLLNFCGAANWLTFSIVPYSAAKYYDTELVSINLLSVIFLFSAIPVGSVATFLIERYGLRPSFLFCAWSMGLGSGIRVLSTIGGLSHTGKLAFLFLGQSVIAIGQPFCTYCPAKTAEAWFSEKERTVANLIGFVANPVGVVIMGLISPLFEDQDSNLDVLNLLLTVAIPSLATAVTITLVMTSSNPPTPPSAAAAKESLQSKEILANLKPLLLNWKYLILLLAVGGSVGIYSSFVTLVTQILCPYGYSKSVAGLSSAVLTLTGVVGGVVIGKYVDIKKNFSTVLKTSYFIVAGGMCIFTGIFRFSIGFYIIILIGGFGLFSFAILPVGLELASEVTYPIGTATSSGLIVLSGQLQSLVLIIIMQLMSYPLSDEKITEFGSTCVSENDSSTDQHTFDFTTSVIVSTSWMALVFLILLFFFKPEYKRRLAEQESLTFENIAL